MIAAAMAFKWFLAIMLMIHFQDLIALQHESLSLQKDLADDVMLYAACATGYKSGGFNTTAGERGHMRDFERLKSLTNFEVGIKSRINRWQDSS